MPIPVEQLTAKLGLTPAAISVRLQALDLTPASLERLAELRPLIEDHAEIFLDKLYDRFKEEPELLAILGNENQIRRLKEQQKKYISSLFQGSIDWPYVLSRVVIGSAHHRVGLVPQWFLSTYPHFITEQSALIFRGVEPGREGLGVVITLLKRILFDVTIILDAYGMATELTRGATQAAAPSSEPTDPFVQAKGEPSLRVTMEAAPTFSSIKLTPETVQKRKNFIGLTGEHQALLQSLSGAWSKALPALLDDFYRFFTSHQQTSALVAPEVVPRLMGQVSSYWQEFCHGTFDQSYASSRVRVGLIHERINLEPQWYLVGLARQAEGLLWASAEATADLGLLVDAFTKALFFDITCVIDAYLNARAQTLLKTEGYANQLVSGLTSGVLILGADRRVLSANHALLSHLRIDPLLLYKVPFEQALPIPELPVLLERVGVEPHQRQRVSAVGRLGSKQFRMTAILLDSWEGLEGRPVAIVLDDITELVRLSDESDTTNHRLARLVQTMDVAVWEMNQATWTIDLISAPVLGLTGFRDVFFLGRAGAWIECIIPEDRALFQDFCRNFSRNQHGALKYRMKRADGREIWVRTSLHALGNEALGLLSGVTRDVTQEHLTEERGRERDLAIAKNQAKSDFLATVSHEIRTPLNGVLGMLDFILENPGKDNAHHLRAAQESALELLGLLNDILDLAKMEAGRSELNSHRFDLVALLETLGELFLPQARNKGLWLQLRLAPQLCGDWEGDALKVRQILTNLLSNAVKFTQDGGVSLEAIPHGKYLRFTVADTGIGVPEAKRVSLFDPFVQAHVSWGGTGLGLAICKQLAQLMGGDVTFEPAPDGGSRFIADLELPALPEPSLPEGRNRVLLNSLTSAPGKELATRLELAGWRLTSTPTKEAIACFFDVTCPPEPLPPIPCIACSTQHPPSSYPGAVYSLGLAPLNGEALRKILIKLREPPTTAKAFSGEVLLADDNTINQRVARLMLERLGFVVSTVTNGKEAVQEARENSYNLILMDVRMPEMDGLEAARLIRQNSKNIHTPIVALTANASAQDRQDCLAAGMTHVLVKPVQFIELKQAIEQHTPRNGAGEAQANAPTEG